jgi:excisionase family DNA binding protein
MNGRSEYVRAADIAALTGASLRTVRRWIADGDIPSVKLGGARLVAKAELQRLLWPLSTTAEEDTKDGDKKRQKSGNS